MDLKDIKLIIDLMKKNDLSVFKMEKDGFKLLLKKNLTAPGGYTVAGTPQAGPQLSYAPLAQVPAGQTPAAANSTPADVPPPATEKLRDISSPMVGTFYQAMSPDAPAYIKVGQVVTEDTVVCIIEAMKVMNEIKSEVAGTVVEIVAENGKPVQFGQALFRVK